jgi:Flp pilus assembly protein TadG
MRCGIPTSPTRPRATRRAVRAGAAALEFAFVAPWFFCLVLGLVEVGRGFMVTHQLNSAARDGCRVGVLSSKTDTDIKTTVANELKAQGISGYTTTILINDATYTTFAPNSNDEIKVRVNVPVANITWLPGGTHLSGSLQGEYNLRRE